ncbi:hypothetical protein N8Z85_01440 [Porticoccus sp.]|nr:hypothetical protein [Porticoccus sp.]
MADKENKSIGKEASVDEYVTRDYSAIDEQVRQMSLREQEATKKIAYVNLMQLMKIVCASLLVLGVFFILLGFAYSIAFPAHQPNDLNSHKHSNNDPVPAHEHVHSNEIPPHDHSDLNRAHTHNDITSLDHSKNNITSMDTPNTSEDEIIEDDSSLTETNNIDSSEQPKDKSNDEEPIFLSKDEQGFITHQHPNKNITHTHDGELNHSHLTDLKSFEDELKTAQQNNTNQDVKVTGEVIKFISIPKQIKNKKVGILTRLHYKADGLKEIKRSCYLSFLGDDGLEDMLEIGVQKNLIDKPVRKTTDNRPNWIEDYFIDSAFNNDCKWNNQKYNYQKDQDVQV